MNFKPLNDRVLLERIESEETTKGGIIIPDNAKEKPLEGKVVATGPGKILDNGSKKELTVKTGDRVLFAKYAETEVTFDDKSYLLIREDDVLGIMA